MFHIGFELLPRTAARARARHEAAVPIPWSDDIKWSPNLYIDASTYPVRKLFDVTPCNPNDGDPNSATSEQKVVSPNGTFMYCEKTLKSESFIDTIYGRKRGVARFNADVRLPALHEAYHGHVVDGWCRAPWMSLTPMEYLTLRTGTKRAKGHVVVAGLGLGHQLVEVARRRQVQRITLVEKSRELIDWIMPRLIDIEPLLISKLAEVHCGDAYEVMPKLTADVALVDVFRNYGGNNYERDRLRRSCKSIGFIWAWGATEISIGGA